MGLIRFLLALSVVVAHAPSQKLMGFTLLSGVTAVQAFYIISGFLITMILNERKEYRSPFNFYLSRYLRLWPPYIVVALITLVVAKWRMEFVDLAKMDFVTQAFLWFSNVTLLLQDWFCFLRADNGHLSFTVSFGAAPPPLIVYYLLAPQCWTLGVEMSFYVVAPFVCRRWWGAVGLFGFGLAARVAIAQWQPPLQDPWLYRFAPAEMMLFASGSLSYFLGTYCDRRARPRKIIPAACMTLLSGLILANDYAMPWLAAHLPMYWPRLYLMNGPVLVLVAAACPFLFKISRASRIDDFLGELSYPIYVSHWFLRGEAIEHLSAPWDAGSLVYVAGVIAFSVLLLVCVVFPVDRIRARFGARVPGTDRAAGAPVGALAPAAQGGG
ncbi:MAG TPA: acyltransferase [Stellaceae bacterium]|nr:acyltransferase [Stellaceae bacterium]